MSEKKRGFFSRLFGNSSEETQNLQEEKATDSAELPRALEGVQSVPPDSVKGLEETTEAVAGETPVLENPELIPEAETAPGEKASDKPHNLDEAEAKALEETAYLDSDVLTEENSADSEAEPDILFPEVRDAAATVAEDTADVQPVLTDEITELSGTEEAGEDVPVKKSWFQRLKAGLSRSSSALTEGISSIFNKRKLDADTLEELEDILIQADLGIDTAIAITDRVSDGRYDKEISGEEVRSILAEEIENVLEPVAKPLDLECGHKPHILLMVGVNGTGKTTTIGKLSSLLHERGKKVMLAAGDTFRAAAVEQLKVWGERTGAEVVARDTGADAAGLAYDAVDAALCNNTDVLLIDTAGRLQNKAELMDELEKIIRVIRKRVPDAPHTTLLTLDATTGQNALSQVEIFGKVAGVTGLVMTKLDGTARGGILVAIARKYGLPVHFIGVGEDMDDLEPFSASDFAAAIAGKDHETD